MRLNSSIVIHAIVFALGLVTGAASVYILGSKGDNRPWILWEHSTNMFLTGSAPSTEEWRTVVAGENKWDCEKRLAKLADDLKKSKKVVVDTDRDVNIEFGFEFDGAIVTRRSSMTQRDKILLVTVTRNLCFPQTFDPRSAASK